MCYKYIESTIDRGSLGDRAKPELCECREKHRQTESGEFSKAEIT